jgi:hypothetical protein
MYNYLASVGLVKSSSTQTASNQTDSSDSSSGSFWQRLFGWFSNLFNRKPSNVASAPSAAVEIDESSTLVPANPPAGGATAPELPVTQSEDMLAGENDLARVQELYYQAFADYNRLLETHSTNSPEVRQALAKLQAAKAKVKELRRRLRQ